MRHLWRLLILILCIVMLSGVVYADSTVESISNYSTIAADGSCDVTLSVTVFLDSPASGLTFPLPEGARDVTMNGAKVKTRQGDAVLLAELSNLEGLSGTYTMSFHYTIPTVLETVVEEKDNSRRLALQLPLLGGFDYPVEYMDFSVTFPTEFTTEPSFSSGYLGNSIESLLDWSINGLTVKGSTNSALQDKESLVMTMNVTEEMFPGQLVLPREGNPETIYMGICTGLAVLYWLLMMRCVPIFRQRRTTPPEGITAGEIGSRLSSAGVDLTMMVFSWAQMGYLRIRPDRNNRVWLEKQMDMGNERTDFEMKLFRTLFSRNSAVDGTGTTYAKLCLKAAQTVSGSHEMYRRKAGNIQIFRILFCGVSVCSGICYGMNLVLRGSTAQILLAIGLAVLGAITGWGIQGGMYRFHIRGKTQQYIGIVCGILWIGLGIYAGVVWIGVAAVAAQMVAGLAAAYGGRRSSLGRLQASQILGLRVYLKRASGEELERLTEDNPEYFFDMLPYAMALGVEGAFARQFDDLNIPQCPYMAVRADRSRSAREWAYLIRKTADKLDQRQREMLVERWTIISFRKRYRPAPVRRPANSRSRRR